MSERASVRVDGRCTIEDRGVPDRLQSAPATRLARPPDAERVCRTTSGDADRRRRRFFWLRPVSLWGQRQGYGGRSWRKVRKWNASSWKVECFVLGGSAGPPEVHQVLRRRPSHGD